MKLLWFQGTILAAICIIPSSVVADRLLESVTNEVSTIGTDPVNNSEVNITKEPSLKVQSSIADAEVSYDPSIKVNTNIKEAEISTEPPVNVISHSAESEVSSQPFVKVNTESADVEVSQKAAVKVDTGVADVEISRKAAVKVDTKVTDVEISPKEPVKVETSIVVSEISPRPSLNIETHTREAELSATPVANDDKASSNIEFKHDSLDNKQPAVFVPSKEEPKSADGFPKNDRVIASNMPVESISVIKQSSMRGIEKVSEARQAVNIAGYDEAAPVIQSAALQPKTFGNPDKNAGLGNMSNAKRLLHQSPVLFVNANNGMVGTSAMANGFTGFGSASGAPFILGNWELIYLPVGQAAYLGKIDFFFDQWLNAPPSQPPESPSFL
ncbi:hypothetical protein D0469_14160 [Peribacillus saganii]|uniref:Uncharacterized protein n=1 Tax=Peribacillus saganii TaxID=2303992 RepID=A0A372LLG3_9BACI|nr:hypothetical protein [Peribacillus saganii]RFU67683.1 hypothetical protein D0469_14160 [Peribacillus saganii]